MTTFNYQGMEYDEKTIKSFMAYSREVNRVYMNQVLADYLGSRWSVYAKDLYHKINMTMGVFGYDPKQEFLDEISDLLKEFREEVGWTKLDEEAIRYLGIKAFAYLKEEDRDRLNAFYVASQQN
jgi:hypothetical protein